MNESSATQEGASARPRLLIIDGYSLLFRAFFAPGPYLSTADGTPTAAVFGFTNSLLSLLEQEKPDSVYVAWDAPGPTFRHETYAEYKGHRPEAGQDLKQQFPIARELVRAFDIAAVETPGFEADDLIGTLACTAAEEGYDVLIVTGDTDALQLVSEHVQVRMVRRGVTDTRLYDVEGVKERYGIPPERIPDYKALVGDSSDNIPGVPGIGDKTATKLLQEYGTVDNLLAQVHDMPAGRLKDALESAGNQPRASRDLATIHCQAPFEGPVQRYTPTPETWAHVRELFNTLEFRSLLRRIPEAEHPVEAGLDTGASSGGDSAGETPESAGPAFAPQLAIIQSQAELDSALAEVRKARRIAVRLLADSVHPMRAAVQGLAFAATPEQAWFVPIEAAGPAASGGLFEESAEEAPAFRAPLSAFAGLMADPDVLRLAHDAKYVQIVLANHDVECSPFGFDTMLAAYLISPGRTAYPIANLAEEHLNAAPEPEDISPELKLAREAALVVALEAPPRRRLESHGLNRIMYQIEIPLIPILVRMERTGVPVDRDWLSRLSADMETQISHLTARIHELAEEPFNIGSTQQLQRILFEKLKLPAGKKIKTGYSTSADLLESLAQDYEICRRILEYREVAKLKSTYADALPRLLNPATGRIHTSLNQTVAATGRLSSSDPNLQNIPIRSEIGREIRKAFIAPPGQVLLSCDYSQIELRIFAHYTRDTELVRAFEADEDIHAATATRLFGVPLGEVTPDMRRRAKTVNFAVIYGQSDFGLAASLGIPNSEARTFIENYFAQFPGVRKYTQETLSMARRSGYVQTLLGRRRYLPEINSGNHNIRQAAERAAVNMPIQGTAADIMKIAMIQVAQALNSICYNCVLLLQVHDELVFAVDAAKSEEAAHEIRRHMEEAYRLDVRLRVDAKVGPNWAEMTLLPA